MIFSFFFQGYFDKKRIQKFCLDKCPYTSPSKFELISSSLSTNLPQNQKIATENEFQSIKNQRRCNKNFNKISNIINNISPNKEKGENKYNDNILIMI